MKRANRVEQYSLKAVLLILLIMPIEFTVAQSFESRVLLNLEFEMGRSQGFHQHDANSALLVAKIAGRFGIYRFDFATEKIELLELVNRQELVDPYIGEPIIEFHTVGGLTFIDIRGSLYSTDGSRAGTQFIRDFGITIEGGSPGQSEFSKIRQMHGMGGKLLFFVFNYDSENGPSLRLHVSDGTRGGLPGSEADLIILERYLT